jgi:lipopolysaccharide transport system ATP-binding protein
MSSEMEPVIRVANLGKKYFIRHQTHSRYETLRDTLAGGARRLLQKAAAPRREEFWALRDVSFEVRPGEKLGIIGRNGAGKTTLLKLLSRITEPSAGRAEIRGRVASLLEVGTGFHPELTGRENIFLNGAILGMRRREIVSKFDEIVAFAEVERFLDTPVKRYSSGMYVRLAFAVAAHLEPEILIVDEVLAVGDLQFQKKCIGKMEDIGREGKTILLVSHNMSSILSLSSKCILLANGRLQRFGLPKEVVSSFQDSLHNETFGQTDLHSAEHYGNGKGRFVSISMQASNSQGKSLPFIETGCNITFSVRIQVSEKITAANVGLTIYDELGNRIIDPNLLVKGDALSLEKSKAVIVTFLLKNVLLKPDLYSAGLWLGIANQEDMDGVRFATSFRVEPRRGDILYSQPFPGVYLCDFEHEIKIVDRVSATKPKALGAIKKIRNESDDSRS